MVVNKLMEKEKSLHKIVLIGAGNLATNLGKVLVSKGYSVVQVYSRTEESAKNLATTLSAAYTTSLDEVRKDATLYIVSLKDSALIELLPEIVADKQDSFFVHTAGSISMDIWKGYVKHYGVFYPMQTFSKGVDVSMDCVPMFVEGSNPATEQFIRSLAESITKNVSHADSELRKRLHCAAVFACNFTNHLWSVADNILRQQASLDITYLEPLLKETLRKAMTVAPALAQTGPARRGDTAVMERHKAMLSPEDAALYDYLSKRIMKQYELD